MKRWFAIALILALLLCGCAQQTQTPAEPQTDAAPAAQTRPETEPENGPEADPADELEDEPVDDRTPEEIVAQMEAEMEAELGIAAPDPEDFQFEILEPEQTPAGIVVDARLYTLTLPADWENRFFAEMIDNWLAIYSKDNFDEGYGGLLCNLAWVEDPEIFDYLPDLRQLGTFTHDGVTYTMIADIPGEDQAPASGPLLDDYRGMKADLDQVFHSIVFSDDVTYIPY